MKYSTWAIINLSISAGFLTGSIVAGVVPISAIPNLLVAVLFLALGIRERRQEQG